MSEYKTMEIRGFYRSHSHLPIWEVMDKAGIWERVGLKVTFEFCDSSSAAEKALFDGSVDFVSGNHISPYLLVRKGKPIVSLTSPSNSVNDKLVARFPIKQVSELRGKRIGDTTLVDSIGGYHHPRGNHMLYVMRAGLRLDEVEWVELTESNKEFQSDAARSCSSPAKLTRSLLPEIRTSSSRPACMFCLWIGLPMINGPTLTSTLTTLQKKEGTSRAIGQSAGDGHPFRPHSARRDREHSRRIASTSSGGKKCQLSERSQTIAQTLSGS